MAANSNADFWRCIKLLKLQQQSLDRIDAIQKSSDEVDEKSIVKPKTLSRYGLSLEEKSFVESSVSRYETACKLKRLWRNCTKTLKIDPFQRSTSLSVINILRKNSLVIYLASHISVNKDVAGVLMVIFSESYPGTNIYSRKPECLIRNKIIRFTCKLSDLLLLPYYVICCFFLSVEMKPSPN